MRVTPWPLRFICLCRFLYLAHHLSSIRNCCHLTRNQGHGEFVTAVERHFDRIAIVELQLVRTVGFLLLDAEFKLVRDPEEIPALEPISCEATNADQHSLDRARFGSLCIGERLPDAILHCRGQFCL